MNGTDQRLHTRTTDALADVIDQTQRAVVERFEEVEASFAAMHDKVTHLVGDERAARGQVEDRLLILENESDTLHGRHDALRYDFYCSWHQTTLYQRLRWLVTGR
jgi:hypothetical protein